MQQEITTPRNVQWVGDSKERLQAFPDPVRKDIGHALYRVQIGETPSKDIDLIKQRLRRAKEMEKEL